MPDGNIYDIQAVNATIEGMLTQEKKFMFGGNQLVVTDKTNNLEARAFFDVNEPNRRGALGGWLGNIGGGHATLAEGEVSKDREDLVEIKISKLPAESEADIVSTGKGSWLENISFDGKPSIWDINMKGIVTEFRKPNYDKDDYRLLLISDSSTRGDAICIANEEWDASETLKHELEELQRHDAKLRKAA